MSFILLEQWFQKYTIYNSPDENLIGYKDSTIWLNSQNIFSFESLKDFFFHIFNRQHLCCWAVKVLLLNSTYKFMWSLFTVIICTSTIVGLQFTVGIWIFTVWRFQGWTSLCEDQGWFWELAGTAADRQWGNIRKHTCVLWR